MTCEEFAKMLDNYESLTNEEKALMSEHADGCEMCRRELDFMRSMINAVKTLPELKVPDDFLENLNKRIDAEVKPVRQRGIAGHIRYNWQKYSAVAACLALAAVIGANYNTLIDNMNGGDDGVISTVTTVASPAPDNSDEIAPAYAIQTDKAAAASVAPHKAEGKNASQSKRPEATSGTAGFNRTGRNAAARTGSANVNTPAAEYALPKLAATSQPESVKAADVPETSKPTDGGVETMTLPRGIYIEARGARIIETPSAGDGAVDDSYEISVASETDGGFAVAMADEAVLESKSTARIYGSSGGGSSDEEDSGRGYSLNPNNKLTVKGEDFAAAFDIVSRYASDSYNNYFMVTAGNLDAMLAALDEAGVSYRSNIGFNADKITFRISIE